MKSRSSELKLAFALVVVLVFGLATAPHAFAKGKEGGGVGTGNGHGGGTIGVQVSEYVTSILVEADASSKFREGLSSDYKVFRAAAESLPIETHISLKDEASRGIAICGMPADRGRAAHIRVRPALWSKLNDFDRRRLTLEAMLVATREEPRGASQLTMYLLRFISRSSSDGETAYDSLAQRQREMLPDSARYAVARAIAVLFWNADYNKSFQDELEPTGYFSFRARSLRIPLVSFPRVRLERVENGKRVSREVMMQNFSGLQPSIQISQAQVALFSEMYFKEVQPEGLQFSQFEKTVLHELLGASDEEKSEVYARTNLLYDLIADRRWLIQTF